MRISDWSSDVCSSDLQADADRRRLGDAERDLKGERRDLQGQRMPGQLFFADPSHQKGGAGKQARLGQDDEARSEEHTSELQSLMRISYAVFCLKKKNQ